MNKTPFLVCLVLFMCFFFPLFSLCNIVILKLTQDILFWRCFVARKYEDEKLEKLFEMIGKNPGMRAAFVAQLLGWQRSAVMRALPAMDDDGLLLYKDEPGQLWTFANDGG